MLKETTISLAHGNGGRLMRELIEQVFAEAFRADGLDAHLDAAPMPDLGGGIPCITTDGFVVEPIEFPGGDIGSLSVHGTVNDLAVAGAVPRYLTLNAFIEEGFETARLARIVESIAAAARSAGVSVIAGDTKVLPRGQVGGLYLATTGVGMRRAGPSLSMDACRAGDRIVVSGPVGNHGAAVMLAREEFGFSGRLASDTASVVAECRGLLALPGLRFMRDPTRGGLATVANELARQTGFDVRLIEDDIPVEDEVRSVCELLGFDPLYLACEGRVVAVVSDAEADAAVAGLREAGADEARAIGTLEPGRGGVILQTGLGGERLLDELEDDPLPRIC